MAQGNYEALLAEQQDRVQAIEKARAGKKRMPKPLPDPVRPRPESQLTADPFTPEMGAELIRSAEAGPVTPSMLKDKGIPRPADTLKILERRGFIKKVGVNETTTKLKNGKTRTNKEPVYESTAAKPPEVAGPGEGTELYIKPIPVQEPTAEGASKGPSPQAIKARFDAARVRADDIRRKLAALPQVGEDWPASRVEAMDSARAALESQLQQADFEVARAQTGRAAFAVVEKVAAPVRTGLSPVDGTVMDTTADTDGAPRENVVHTFPTRQKAQEWLDAKQGTAAAPAPDIQTTPENKTAGRDARQEKALKSALKELGLSDETILKVEGQLDEGAAGYAETSDRDSEGRSIQVLIALSRDAYDPNLSDAENLAKMMETLHHEAIHALRRLGKFTSQEWNVLGKEVRSRKMDGKEYTYLQWANEKYRDTYLNDDGNPDMDAIVEEAVAEMTKDWYKSGGKIGARYTGLMNRIVQFFKKLLKMQRADSVLTKVMSGEVGARTRQDQSGADQRMYADPSRRQFLVGLGASIVAAGLPTKSRASVWGSLSDAVQTGEANKVLNWIAVNGESPEFKALAGKMLDNGGVGSRTTIGVRPLRGLLGSYRMASAEIALDPAAKDSQDIILHELIHAFVGSRYHTLSMATERNRELAGLSPSNAQESIDEIKRLWDVFGGAINKDHKHLLSHPAADPRGQIWASEMFGHPDEFVSWALTDPDAQAFMKTIDAKGKPLGRAERGAPPVSMWDKFVDWVRKLMGLKPSANTLLKEVLTQTDKMFSEGGYDAADHSTTRAYLDYLSGEEDMAGRKSDRRFMLTGARSMSSQKEDYDKFLKMEKAGERPSKIYQETAWYRGGDGQPRHSISDAKSRLRHAYWPKEIRERIAKAGPNATSTYEVLEDVLKHKELFEAYPGLAPLPVEFTLKKPDGSLMVSGDGQTLPDRIVIGVSKRADSRPEEEMVVSAILRQTQLAVRQMEGWPADAQQAEAEALSTEGRRTLDSRNVRRREPYNVPGSNLKIAAREEVMLPFAEPPVPSDRRFSFASTKSQRPPRDNYAKFLKMEKAGDSRGTIYLHTGWFRGPDGKPRYEISDNDSRLKPVANASDLRGDLAVIRQKQGVLSPSIYSTIEEVLDHPELFEAYPFLRNVTVEFADETNDGSSFTVGNAAMTPVRTGEPPDRILIAVGKGGVPLIQEAETIRAVLLHEIQHAIQTFEGMAGGGNPNRMPSLATVSEAVRRRFESVNKELVTLSKNQDIDGFFKAVGSERSTYTPSQIKSVEHLMGALSVMGVPPSNMSDIYKRATNFAVYKSLYGEMEARNTESRINMTPAERLRNAPWRTVDVNENLGISMTLDEKNALLAQIAAKKAAASGVSHYNSRNGFTPLETIENLQALAEKNRAAGLNDMADEMLEMASFVDPFGIRPDNIPRISDRRFSYAGARIHSRLGQVINAQTTKKATAQQWLKTLESQPGVTKDEMDWVGFTDLLKENPDKVMTLEELKEFFEENNIVLEDIKRGPGSIEDPVDKEMFDAMVQELMDELDMDGRQMDREQAEGYVAKKMTSAAEWDTYNDYTVDDGLVANHSNYTLRGGHTETELLITIPGSINPKLSPVAFRATEHFREYNVLAHVRYKIRDDVNGVPTLFIEEIQSDWHQRLRRSHIVEVKVAEAKRILQAEKEKAIEFYENNMAEPPDFSRTGEHNVLSRFTRASNYKYWPDRQTHEAAEAIRFSLRKAQEEYDKIQLLEVYDTPPEAPFKNNAWVKLATRRIILDAIDNGITQISWTPGHIQVERYSNDQSVKGVGKFYDDVITSIIGKEIKPYGAQINNRQFDIPEGDHPITGGVMPARTLDAPTFHITPKMREVVNGEGFRLYSKGATLPRGMTEADLDALDAAMSTTGKTIGGPSPEVAAMGGSGAAEMAARYTIVQDYLAKGTRVSPIKVAEADARDAIDRATTLAQDRMFPVRRMVSEVAKFGGRVTDTNDPVLADTLYTRRSQHKMDKAHENLWRPAYLAIHQIGATEADLAKLSSVSNAARLELESSHVHPSEAVLNLYLYARHAPERNKFIEEVRKAKEIDPDTGEITDEMLDAGSGMTNEEAAAIMDWFDGYSKQSKVEAAASKVDAILDYTRKTRETSGLSPKWDDIVSPLVPRFKHYVPLRGFAVGNTAEDWFTGDEHARTGKAYKVGGKEDRAMKGRQTYAGDMLANVIMQNQEAIVRSEKVRVGQSLARFVRDNPELTKDYLVELPAHPMQRVVVNGKTRMSPKDVKGDPNYFVTKENGKDVIFEVKNKRLGDSLSKIQSFGGSLPDLILSRMARLTRLMSQLQTSYNPEFLVANFLRDVQAAMIQSGQYSPDAWQKISKKAMVYAGQAVGERLGKKDPVLEAKMDRLSELGGLTGVYGLTSIEDQMQQITRELNDIDPQDKNAGAKALRLSMKAIGKGFKYLEDLNDSVEGATRLAVFEAFREQGWSEERAAQAAKDMTVNFNRKGEWGPYMNAAYMFFNAATQGTATLMQAATSPRVQKVIMGIMVAGVLQEVLMSALSPEDEYGTSEYDKIEDYILEKNMVIMLGGGNYLKIPMPLGYNVFHTAGRNMARVAMGKSGPLDAAMKTGSSVLSAFNPFGTNGSWVSAIFPSVFRPMVETAVNTDFTGKPIHPTGMPGLEQPASQSFFPSTSQTSQGIADVASRLTGGDSAYTPGAIEVHPDDIDHMAGAYLGGMGRFVGRVGNLMGFAIDPQSKAVEGRELAARDWPLYRSFGGNVSGASIRTSYDKLITPYLQFGRSVDQFESEGNYEAVNSLLARSPERMMIYDFAADMERERIKTRREIREVQTDPQMDDASKVAIVKQLRDEEQVLMNLTIQQIRELERQAGL
jgi:hypothetical protein